MKTRSIILLVIAEICAMCLWFVTASVLPDMLRDGVLSPTRQALLSSAVQAGFVVGALVSALLTLPDRYDPRRLFALCVVVAALANASLLLVSTGGYLSIALRFLTGAMLAGVYPVGMKIVVGWGTRDRGWLVGLLVGALTLGSASPYLFAWFGGSNWRATILAASVIAASGGLLVLLTALGPHHQKATRFNLQFVRLAWTHTPIRLAILGYLGHMWELYAMWSWIGVATTASFFITLNEQDALALAKLAAFVAIAAGGIACVLGGYIADRIGKAQLTIIAMLISASAALATALSFGGPAWVTCVLVVIWGAAVVPDSAQFSALIADYSPPESTGSLMTLQTALGFALTILTVQLAPLMAAYTGWPWVLAILAAGPLAGVWAMRRLQRWQSQQPHPDASA